MGLERSAPRPAEDQLVGRAQAGDVTAFADLVTRYAPSLERFTRHLLGDAEAAQDLAQETFLVAQQSMPTLREPDRFGSWLCGIAGRPLDHGEGPAVQVPPAPTPRARRRASGRDRAGGNERKGSQHDRIP